LSAFGRSLFRLVVLTVVAGDDQCRCQASGDSLFRLVVLTVVASDDLYRVGACAPFS